MNNQEENNEIQEEKVVYPIFQSFTVNLLIMFSAGFQDAYTYIVRHGVFANAQTGNIVLMGTYLLQKDGSQAIHYLLPLLAFGLGILTSSQIELNLDKNLGFAKRLVLILEIISLGIVGFIPDKYFFIANMLVSFSCAMQLQSFRSIKSHAYASTMCIGNFRSGVDAISNYIHSGEKSSLKNALYYILVVGVFALGAGLGGNISAVIGIRAIWISVVILIITFIAYSYKLAKKRADQ